MQASLLPDTNRLSEEDHKRLPRQLCLIWATARQDVTPSRTSKVSPDVCAACCDIDTLAGAI